MYVEKYVLGFLFSNDCTSCVFIRKKRPHWQSGLLNGVGGKIDAGELPIGAMRREFKEETGVDTGIIWFQFCEMTGAGFMVFCFTARDSYALQKTQTCEEEEIERYDPNDIKGRQCVPNLVWLVEMAMAYHSAKGCNGPVGLASIRYYENRGIHHL